MTDLLPIRSDATGPPREGYNGHPVLYRPSSRPTWNRRAQRGYHRRGDTLSARSVIEGGRPFSRAGYEPVVSSPATPAAPGRAALVEAAVQTWKSQLVNLGGRNTLLYYRDQKVGTLDLAQTDPGAVATLMAGRPVRLS